MDDRAAPVPLILASASPRRRGLLAQLSIPFIVVPSAIDEDLAPASTISLAVADLACRKARAVAAGLDAGLVLGADTVVVLGDEVLGKPAGPRDAERMLRRLSGRSHAVITGVAIVEAASGRGERSAVVSVVRMRDLSDAQIAGYVATGEPLDKAGSYAVQGAGGALVAVSQSGRPTTFA
jgi:septum formation protein